MAASINVQGSAVKTHNDIFPEPSEGVVPEAKLPKSKKLECPYAIRSSIAARAAHAISENAIQLRKALIGVGGPHCVVRLHSLRFDTLGMGNETAELVSLPVSPWTVKVPLYAAWPQIKEVAEHPLPPMGFKHILYMVQALWALDFNKAHYKTTSYTPLSGESWLRRKTGKKEGLITVPVMFAPEGDLRPPDISAYFSRGRSHLLLVSAGLTEDLRLFLSTQFIVFPLSVQVH